jgi:hypothetical protein
MKINLHMKKAFILLCGGAAAIVIGAAMSLTAVQSAHARPQYAAQTGKAYGQCHANPAGGGPLKPFGEQFKANGHKLPK